MKNKDRQLKIFICKFCKTKNDTIGIIQKEEHFYKYYLNTNQWEDFHGDENVESKKYFCLNCHKEIRNLDLIA